MCNSIASDFVPFLDIGASRKVYAINDNLVMKVAQYLDNPEINWGTSQCITEIAMYKEHGNKLPLCKVMLEQSSAERVIMERVIPLTELEDGLERFGTIDTLVYNLYKGIESKEYLSSLNIEMQEFAKNILESGLTRDEISAILVDVAYPNIGIKNNKLVILDYGMVQKF